MSLSFKRKPKPDPAAASKGEATKRPSSTPQPMGNAAVQEMIPEKAQEQSSSLLEPETAAPTKKAAKGGKKPVSPEDAALQDAMVREALIKSGLMAGPKKEKAPKEKAAKDPNAPAKKGMGKRMGSAVRGVGSAASSAASAVGSGVSSAASAVGSCLSSAASGVSSAAKGVKKGLGFGGRAAAPLDATAEAEKAPETWSEMQARVQAQFKEETDAFVRENADGSTFASADYPAPDVTMASYLPSAHKFFNEACTPEVAHQRQVELADPGQEVAPDPFMYKTDNLNKEEVEALKTFGLTSDEIVAVVLYTGGAYTEMNEILRGVRKDEATMRLYQPWCILLDKALSKMPKNVRNAQVGATIDETKAPGEKLALTTAYRTDTMKDKPKFVERVAAGWKEGGRLADKGFMSATTTQGAYGAGMEVSQIIDVSGAEAAASVIDLSQKKKENEVLFRPGTEMQFVSITDNTTGERVYGGDVAAHAEHEGKQVGELSLTAHTKVVGSPGKSKKESGESTEEDPGAKEAAKEADLDTVRRILARSNSI